MYLGIDIGGTKTLVASFDDRGVMVDNQRFATPDSYPAFIRSLARNVAKIPTKEFTACGVAIPGKVDRKHGVGVAFGNLPWRSVPIAEDIERMLHCPILVENDANLAGLSEAQLVKDTYDKVLYVTISTGIGTGVIIEQQIDPYFADAEGGEILLEHKGKLQMWEHFASGSAIVRRFGKRASDITDEATWKIIAHDLALGLVDLIAVIQPQVIIFGGSVSEYYDRFGDFLEAELARYATPLSPRPVLKKAERPDQAVVFGCFDLARTVHGKHRTKIAV